MRELTAAVLREALSRKRRLMEQVQAALPELTLQGEVARLTERAISAVEARQ